MHRSIFVCVALLISISALAAVVPSQINYQGFLTAPDGSPLDTVVNMTFSIYQNSAGGTSLWSETHNNVPVTNGLFDVHLGETSPLSSDNFWRDSLWLGVTVGTNSEMTPRIRFLAVPYSYRVGTVDYATGGSILSQVFIADKANIGSGNTNTGTRAFVVGENNVASGHYSAVGGGSNNTAYANHSTVAGGADNQANGEFAAICGGQSNRVAGQDAFVGGGQANEARDIGAVVGGGTNNKAGYFATVAGGGGSSAIDSNSASAPYTFIGGGSGHVAVTAYSAIGGGYHNRAAGQGAFVGGGYQNEAKGWQSFVGGGYYNRARGDYSVVAGGGGPTETDSNSASGGNSVIGGGYHNVAGGFAATIAGGYYHTSSGNWATVGGGYRNTSSNYCTTVGGGANNGAVGQYATVSGGGNDSAYTDYSTVSGGRSNVANGSYSTVPGGHSNRATGDYSFAAGRRAKANHDGCFVWGDSYNGDITSDSANSFTVRASGGVRMYSNTALTAGVRLYQGASAWTAVSDSTLKRNIRLVDTRDVLDRVSRLPIKQWSYKAQDPSVEHIGPMAQDFWSLFHIGDDSLSISTIDPDGIALAAIQELAKRMQLVEAENAALRAQVQTLMAARQESSVLGKDK
jgi:hypothetical protein